VRGGDANRQRLSRFLPPHPLIHHQGHATLELHNGLGRDGFDLGNIQMESGSSESTSPFMPGVTAAG